MRHLPSILCLFAVPTPASAETVVVAPVHLFFLGCTQGHGILNIVTRRSRMVTVDSLGRQRPDGTLIVTQTVKQEGKPVTVREWRLRENGLNQFVGTLSGATGPVVGVIYAGALDLRFKIKGGLHARQRISPSQDGNGLLNVMTFRKFGVVVGRLREEIERCAAAT